MSPPARPRSALRDALADPAVAAVLLYALVSMAAAAAAYFSLFIQFAGYDDEGTVLVTLDAFAGGETLYQDIYTPYGPFYYELFGGLLALSGLDVTTELSRSTVLVVWVATSLLLGLACQRLTGSLLLGVTGMIAAFASLYVLANEPMHPHGLCALLLAAFTLLAVRTTSARALWTGAACGLLLAALALTKVNLGAFAIAGVAVAAVLTVEPLRRRAWVRWPVLAAFLLVPVYVLGRDMEEAWVRDLTLIEILAGVALFAAAWPSRPVRDEGGTVVRWLFAAAAGFAAGAILILVAILITGPSPADIYDGMITEAIRVRDVLLAPLTFPGAAVDWAVIAVAAAFLATRLRFADQVRQAALSGGLRIAAGLAIWLSVAHITPLSLNPSAGNALLVPMMLAWVAALPAGEEPPERRFLRVLLPAIALAGTLQVYPVAGSQTGIAAVAFVPVGAICIADGLAALRSWAAARGSVPRERLALVALVASTALAALFAVDAIVRPATGNAIAYSNQRSLPFDGARALRLPEAETEIYARVVELLDEHRCTDFIGYPNINSLYLWSGIDPPAPRAPGAWIEALEPREQQRAVNELRRSPRPCAIRNDARAGLWLHEDAPPDTPLVRYIFNDFRLVEQVGDFQFLLPARPGS